MNSMTLSFTFLCLLMTVVICGSELYNYSTAVAKCKQHNGLASYERIINSERRIAVNNTILANGRSAWISGTDLFSDKILRWHGCFGDPSDSLNQNNFSTNNISECLTVCTAAQYICIVNSSCYIISQDDLQHRLTLTNNSDCNHHFSITDFDTALASSNKYNKTIISVYTLNTTSTFMWNPISNKNLGQCVYYQIDGKSGSYVTGSCLTKEIGYICTKNDNGEFSKKCGNENIYISNNNQSYCYYSGPSTWISSVKHCKQLSLDLIGTLDTDIKRKVNQSIGSVSFWTGYFRVFKFTEFSNESNICQSVMNVNSTFVFDPVDCSSEKGYICEDVISKNEEQTTVEYRHSTKTEEKISYSSDEVTSLSSTTVGYGHKTEKPDLSDHYIITIPLVIFVLILISVCMIFRKKIKQLVCVRLDKTRTTNSHEVKPNNISSKFKLADKSSYPRRQETINHPINPEVEYAIPSKILPTCEVEDEIPSEILPKREVEYDMPSEVLPINDVVNSEYDRVNTNLFRQQTRDQSSTRNDINEYDVHTGITRDDDTNEYDHLEAHVRKQLKVSTDRIYNTMAAENETYNVLTLKG